MLYRFVRLIDRLRGDAYEERPVGGGFHLWWQGIVADAADPIISCEVTLEVLREPQVPALYFWAMQMSFLDAHGHQSGSAHIGLQWNQRHPTSRAVNWGGYAQASDVTSILEGSHSSLPSAPDDRNTRDYPWRSGAPYRLAVRRSERGWSGSITDVERSSTVEIRELFAGGDRLDGFVVWSELFCSGTDPRSAVRWSRPIVHHTSGRTQSAAAMTATYPGGAQWRRLDTRVDSVGITQLTDCRRLTPHQTAMTLPSID